MGLFKNNMPTCVYSALGSGFGLIVLIYALFNDADNSLNYCFGWLHNPYRTNFGGRVILVGKFYIWRRLSLCNLPHVTLLTPRILRWFIHLLKICSPLYWTMYLRKRLWVNPRVAHYCGILLDGQKKFTENCQSRYSMSQPRSEVDISKKEIWKWYLMNQFRLYLRLHCISSHVFVRACVRATWATDCTFRKFDHPRIIWWKAKIINQFLKTKPYVTLL